MNGVAIYPSDVRGYSIAAFLARSSPFDRVLSSEIDLARQVSPLNKLLGHYLKPSSRSPLPIETQTDALELLKSGYVLYHGSSDGALARFMLNSESLPTSAQDIGPSKQSPEPPSFTRQTNWKSGYLDLPKAPRTVYFNCSITDHFGSLYLFTRRWRYNHTDPRWNTPSNTSDLAIFRLNPDLSIKSGPLIPSLPRRHTLEQWEDPRVMLGADGRLYASFVTWTHKQPFKFHQIFTRLATDMRSIEAVDDIAYGGNGTRPFNGTAHEKNWTWFQHEAVWHCQYSINPSEVFSARNGSVANRWAMPERELPWKHSAPLRGGTPPVRSGDEYITFFHSYLPWREHRRRYFLGAAAFESKPPFAMTRITELPLLSGSESDVMTLPNALPCIFACGALLRGKEWLVTFGVNDEACGWIRIPHSDLDALLVPIASPTIATRITRAFTRKPRKQ